MIIAYGLRSAEACLLRVVGITAWAWIHSGDQREAGWKFELGIAAREMNFLLFQRLTEGFDASAREFGNLVDK